LVLLLQPTRPNENCEGRRGRSKKKELGQGGVSLRNRKQADEREEKSKKMRGGWLHTGKRLGQKRGKE